MDKNICNGLSNSNRCKKLNVNTCTRMTCAFYQTMEQERASRQKTFSRLASLDKEQQIYIAEKYYGGETPWLKGGTEYDS